MQTIKCIAVGDGAAGKTCMLMAYSNGYVPDEYIPTVFDTFSKHIEIDKRIINLELWDTAGQEDYDRLRSICYRNTDVFLVCFSVADPFSFENIKLKWIPEITHFCPHSKIILIGTKCDIRDESSNLQMTKEKSISYWKGLMLAQEIGAFKYLECSAVKQVGLAEIFNSAVESILYAAKPVKTKGTFCSVL